uniref:Taste receptor type 1 member 3 n=1 Tax=Malurus cyaneus samueli TaxID=2593467 RepID=A0A8C5TN65_9PASS
MFRELFLWLSLRAVSPDPSCLSAQLRSPGDFILGGLFPLGKDAVNLSGRSEPTPLFADGLIWALAMKFAIEQINNSSSLLPGITLGYDMHDTCFEALVALQPSLLFLSRKGTAAIGVLCNYTEYQPRVTAVIGPHQSDLCLVTARLFSSFLIPQVSYGASSESLSNTELYPSFYRTLLNQFGWNWIATVASDDEYGRGAQALFLSMVGNDNICVAFEGLVPTELAQPGARQQLDDTVRLINSTKVNVIVLFAYNLPARALLERSMILPQVWIGTEAWMMSGLTAAIPGVQNVGTVLGFVMKTGAVPGFPAYAAELLGSVRREEFCRRSGQRGRAPDAEEPDTRCPHCDRVTRGDIQPGLGVATVQPVHVAVYSVAHALHRALGCTARACPKTPIRSWQVRQTAGTAGLGTFRFDQSHGTNAGYKLIFWSWSNGTLSHLPVGDYEQSLYIHKAQIRFHTADQKPPSECFRRCQPGQFRRIKGFNLCCYDCTDCPENTFWSSTGEVGPLRASRCVIRCVREGMRGWGDSGAPPGVPLAVLCSSHPAQLHRGAVRSEGKREGMLGVQTRAPGPQDWLSGQVTVPRSPGRSLTRCGQSPAPLGGCHSGCDSSSVSVTVPSSPAWALRPCCAGVTSVLGADEPLADYTSLPGQVLLVCDTKSWLAFALLHGHNGCVAFVCFLLARGIAFATLGYFIVWIFFVVIFATLRTVLRAVAQMCTVLATALAILGSFFLPKAYIMVCRPELNTHEYCGDPGEEEPGDSVRGQ